MFTSEINESQVSALELLGDLSEEEFSYLRKALAEAPLAYEPEELAEELFSEDKFEDLDIDEFSELIFLLVNMFIYRYRSAIELETVISAFVETFAAIYDSEELQESSIESLIERLGILLSEGRALQLCAHSVLSMERRDKVVTAIGVNSSIEPLFLEDEDDEPHCGLVNNVLSIAYTEGGEERVMSLSVDQSSLELLHEEIEKLFARNEKLLSRLARSEMPALIV